ncbi:MAG: hypothetical protein LBI33_00615, partial [Propionibacteriaceae bacterium]|nr:hypothetical protein [Propionibacteriaceae bacterium]
LTWSLGLAADIPGVSDRAGTDEGALVRSQLVSGSGVIPTTSTGRLFDAAAALLGVRHTVTYEAQAAMELEALARRCAHDHTAELLGLVDLHGLIERLITGLREQLPTACLARFFHVGLTRLLVQALNSVQAPPATIGLTGGVLANRLLAGGLTLGLTAAGYRVVSHQVVPANDGGLALGQALAGTLREG